MYCYRKEKTQCIFLASQVACDETNHIVCMPHQRPSSDCIRLVYVLGCNSPQWHKDCLTCNPTLHINCAIITATMHWLEASSQNRLITPTVYKLVQGAFGIGGAALISKACKEVGKEQEWRKGRGARI